MRETGLEAVTWILERLIYKESSGGVWTFIWTFTEKCCSKLVEKPVSSGDKLGSELGLGSLEYVFIYLVQHVLGLVSHHVRYVLLWDAEKQRV